MMPKRFGEAGKEQFLADYIRYRRERASKPRKIEESKPVDSARDSNEFGAGRKPGPDGGDASKNGEPEMTKLGRRKRDKEEERRRRRREEERRLDEERKRREEERRRRDAERRRREDEDRMKRERREEERRRREYEESRRRAEQEERRNEDHEARGRWGHDPASSPDPRGPRGEDPKQGLARRLSDVERDEGFQKFWKWVHNGKKNDFGVSKRLLFYDG